jgi:hypothetical protein
MGSDSADHWRSPKFLKSQELSEQREVIQFNRVDEPHYPDGRNPVGQQVRVLK